LKTIQEKNEKKMENFSRKPHKAKKREWPKGISCANCVSASQQHNYNFFAHPAIAKKTCFPFVAAAKRHFSY